MIRVMVADDQDIVRQGMRRILERSSGLEVVCEGTTKLGTIESALANRPDVLLLDLMWFDDPEAGIDVIKRLARELPTTQTIAITQYPDLMERARAAGARSAVNKDLSTDRLVEEVRAVYRVPPSEDDGPAPAPAVEPRPESLTEREQDVLDLMAEGLGNPEIGEALHIASSTTKNHVSRILGKLGVRTRTAAVTKAIKQGLIWPGRRKQL
jgi:DNA-binding NarL/FixJ family response regulator